VHAQADVPADIDLKPCRAGGRGQGSGKLEEQGRRQMAVAGRKGGVGGRGQWQAGRVGGRAGEEESKGG